MQKVRVLIFTICTFFSWAAVAQQGIIRGQIIDDKNAEALIGVTVLIEGTSTGAATDLDGKFEIRIAEGTYNLQISYVSYAPILVQDVVVKSGEVNALGAVRLKEDIEQLGEVVVVANAIRVTEEALLTVKRKSVNLIDGISAANFKKIGDSDAAAAMSRVTGVSVQSGKYVYVRGLGDRYTKTTLNGMDIPGLDPDRNTVQMDIFPTNIIDNIIVSKSFTADQPADFTGGVVDIQLNDFPEEKVFSINIGLGYNPAMHFNSQYITYDGGKTDFLGIDDGHRAIPTDRRTDIPQFANVVANPNGEKGQEYRSILRGFNPQMSGYRTTSFMDNSMSLAYANQLNVKGYTLGYNAAITYKNDVEYYEGAEFNLFAKPSQPTQTEMIALERQTGDFGVNNVLLGGMFGLALKSDLSKIRLNVLHLQNGESKAGMFDFINTNLGANFEASQYNLEYSERMLTNLLLEGNHRLPNKWHLNWKVSPTRSSITDPDIRFLRFREPNQTISTEVGLPTRIWRFLEEYNISTRTDVSKEYDLFGYAAKLHMGAAYTYKTRSFDIQSFQINTGNTQFNGDPNELFNEENLFSDTNINGVRYEPLFIPTNPNSFSSYVHHAGLYLSNEFHIVDPLKAIVGVRVEKFDQFYTGTNQTGTLKLENDNVISDLDLFPTMNLIYTLTENQNIRFSAARTIARPSFKEMSYAEILDPITGRTFIGGMLQETTNNGTEVLWDGNLRSTRINNFDLRWELFQKRGQMISLSGFFKTFENPIEMVQFLADPGSFQARNVGDARVLGAEVELRQSLGMLTPALENVMFNANLTLTESSIEMSESELRSRRASAREGESVPVRRAMAGQAPYLINTGLSYAIPEIGLQTGMYYNVQGETLMFVGFGNRTDVYAVPFHALNFKASKSFGENDKMSVSMKVSNILNDDREQIFKSYNAEDQLFTSLRPQRTFSFSFGYKF